MIHNLTSCTVFLALHCMTVKLNNIPTLQGYIGGDDKLDTLPMGRTRNEYIILNRNVATMKIKTTLRI
jgi:hypothetical protein